MNPHGLTVRTSAKFIWTLTGLIVFVLWSRTYVLNILLFSCRYWILLAWRNWMEMRTT